ncbi:MAG: hypothetical protein GY705_22570 [Bacteroidetes bacterium]|nr:hypothetical protein [Bacteroidota bacterium]
MGMLPSRFVLLIFSFAFIPNTTISKIQYLEAADNLRKNLSVINEVASEFSHDSREVLSVVFPELIRYNMFRDFLETKALEILYVQFGAEKADFSIGPFQMKPSFIEQIEDVVKNDPLTYPSFEFIYNYNVNDEKSIRKERLRRIQSFEWQLKYAFVFYQIGLNNFEEQFNGSQENEIRFLATAYNTGFEKSLEEINKWMQIPTFPYGPQYEGSQYVYSDISLEFYSNYSSFLKTDLPVK